MVKKLIFNIVGIVVPLYLIILCVQIFLDNTILGYLSQIPSLEKLNPNEYRFGMSSFYYFFTDFGNIFSESHDFLGQFLSDIVQKPLDQWLNGSIELAIEFGTYVETFDLGALLVDFNSFEDVFTLLKGYADYFYNFGMMIMMFIFILGYWIFSPLYTILTSVAMGIGYLGAFIITFLKTIINLITGAYNVPINYELYFNTHSTIYSTIRVLGVVIA